MAFKMSMLQERNEALCRAFPGLLASWFLDPTFFTKLIAPTGELKFAEVESWGRSKKIDVFSLDKMIIPVHVDNTHWALIVVFMQKKQIVYYDSLNWDGKRYLEATKFYLKNKMNEKGNIDGYDWSEWELLQEKNIPQQAPKSNDCGVFALTFADFISEDLPLDFSSEHMEFFRRKIGVDILRGSLDYDLPSDGDVVITGE